MILLGMMLALLATSVPADGRKMLGAHEQRHWQAVGRLNTGNGFCTASLVAADMVVTAAHCLFVQRTGAQRQADRVQFVAGYRLRKYAEHQRAERIMIHPDYAPSQKVDAAAIGADLALVRLKAPLTKAKPLPLAPGLQPGDQVLILSYGRDRPEIPSIQSPCGVVQRSGPVAVLDCDVTYGVSGAPVMRMIDSAPHIMAVVSAMGSMNGAPRAFAVMLEDSLDAVLAAP